MPANYYIIGPDLPKNPLRLVTLGLKEITNALRTGPMKSREEVLIWQPRGSFLVPTEDALHVNLKFNKPLKHFNYERSRQEHRGADFGK